MTEKDNQPLHKKTFPYIMLVIGLCFGLGIAIDWDLKVAGNWNWDVGFKTQLETEKSVWDIVASIGAILAGIGTIGLLVLGWITTQDWKKQHIYKEKRSAITNWKLEIADYIEVIKNSHVYDIQYELHDSLKALDFAKQRRASGDNNAADIKKFERNKNKAISKWAREVEKFIITKNELHLKIFKLETFLGKLDTSKLLAITDIAKLIVRNRRSSPEILQKELDKSVVEIKKETDVLYRKMLTKLND